MMPTRDPAESQANGDRRSSDPERFHSGRAQSDNYRLARERSGYGIGIPTEDYVGSGFRP
jgi:hypothetical protein